MTVFHCSFLGSLFIGALTWISLVLSNTWAGPQADPNVNGWKLLLNNDPDQAKTIFSAAARNPDPLIAGEAHRGLARAAMFLGDDEEACRELIESFKADHDTLRFAAGSGILAVFSRTAEGYRVQDAYPVVGKLASQPGPFCGQFQDLLCRRLLEDGKLSKAEDIVNQMGCILKWKYIGPFENVSNSGFAAEYAPERELDFSKSYRGKSNTTIAWHDLVTAPTSPWIWGTIQPGRMPFTISIAR